MTETFPTSLWLIGCGNMAGAMVQGWLRTGVDPQCLTAIRPSGQWVAGGVRVLPSIPDEDPPAVALLAVKPQVLDTVAPTLAEAIGADTLLVSILAGVQQAALRERFPHVRDIVRMVPNTPVQFGQGAIALYADRLGPRARAWTDALVEWLGTSEWIEDESLFDLVAALTASGPAFVFRFIDALAAGATKLGLPGEQAARFATAMVAGAGTLARVSPETPHVLAERVASPGGMTRQGLNVLDADNALNDLIRQTLDAAARHSRAMGDAARGGPG